MQRNVLSLTGLFMAGFLLGWLVMGWLVWPVQYVGDAYTYELNQADKQRYAEAVIDSFTLTRIANPDWFAGWTPEELADVLTVVSQQPNRAAGAYTLAAQQGVALGTVGQPLAVANRANRTGVSWLALLVGVLVGAVGAVIVSLVIFGLRRLVVWLSKRTIPDFKTQPFDNMFTANPPAWTAPASKPKPTLTGTPARFIYQSGEPFDKALPVERDGEKLGEYGMSKIEGENAFDVWLYDPRDLRTVTKVLANQPSSELASRGEVLPLGGMVFELSTTHLRLSGQVDNFLLNDAGEFIRLTATLSVEIVDD